MAAENKTKATSASVEGYIRAIEDEARREDCRALVKLMTKVTREKATMWGTGIVGFGGYHYTYDSGREGDACRAGFSSRKGPIALYVLSDFPGQGELLAKLGKHKTGKVCLYVSKLADIDVNVLEKLVAGSFAEMKRRYPREAV